MADRTPTYSEPRDLGTARCALEECSNLISSRRKNTKYCCEAHRQEAYRRRVKAAARANGLPANLSLKTVQATGSTGKRSGDAPKRRKSGQSVRISYRKALDHLDEVLTSWGHPAPRTTARQVLHPLLTERQKETLRDAA